jgi:hypothetical protein
MARVVGAGRAERVVSGGVSRGPQARYLPIAEHGLIGDLHTVALVGTDGTIDWYCCPRFDSPSVFAAILDADDGGSFRISPDCEGCSSKQLYLPDTNVLITRFLMPDGVAEVQDFMPPRTGGPPRRHRMIRRVLAVRGYMRFVVDVAPRFDYARARHEVRRNTQLPAHAATVARSWRIVRNQVGIGNRLHDLRHFYASGLIRAGCDVVTVQRALGHSSAAITLTTYSHLWPDANDRTRRAAGELLEASLGAAADQLRTESEI